MRVYLGDFLLGLIVGIIILVLIAAIYHLSVMSGVAG